MRWRDHDGADEHNHDVGDVVHGEHDHDCVLGGAEGEQEAVHRPGGQPQRRSHDGEDQVRFAIDDLCIYHWLFVLIIIPTERQVEQFTSLILNMAMAQRIQVILKHKTKLSK